MFRFLFGKLIGAVVKEQIGYVIDDALDVRLERILALADKNDKYILGIIQDEINSLFNDKAKDASHSMYGAHTTINGKLKDKVADIVMANIKEGEKKRLDELMAGDEILDKVVARILRKQLIKSKS